MMKMRPYNRIAAVVGTLICVALLGCSTKSDEQTTNFESKVPGVTMYVMDRYVGELPLSLTVDDVVQAGLPIHSATDISPEYEHKGNHFIMSDGWCEGFFAGDEDESETKIFFRAPDDVLDDYLTLETPWGIRTKTAGMGFSAVTNTYSVPLHESEDGGLRLRISSLPTVGRRSTDPVPVEVTLENAGEDLYEGGSGYLALRWGTFRTPWRRRSATSVSLPDEWLHVAPGDTLTMTVEMTPPNVADDYSVGAYYNLLEGGGSRKFATKLGTVYSNSRLLKVR